MSEPKAVARNTDPDTSWEAAARVQRIRESQEEVLECLRRDGAMTDEEIALAYSLAPQAHRQSPSGLRTRRAELRDLGIVRDSGKRIVGSTGRRMIVWEIPGPLEPNPISPLRPPGSYTPPAGDPACPVHGSTCRKVWHRAETAPGSPRPSQEGVPDHLVRLERDGKADVYVNPGKARADGERARVQAGHDEEIRRKKATPRVDPSTHRVSFGGPRPCDRCGGTGGTLWEACYGCGGSGLR